MYWVYKKRHLYSKAFEKFNNWRIFKIFSDIRTKAENASRQLADEYGQPLWCKGTGMRNTHLLAIAPTVSNSTISGGVSAGIEPVPANVYTFNSAKGTFIRKNPTLVKLLRKHKINTNEI